MKKVLKVLKVLLIADSNTDSNTDSNADSNADSNTLFVNVKSVKAFFSKCKYVLFFSFICLASTFIFLASSYLASAQEVFESEGKDFWLTFMPNIHSSIDSLYVFITAEAPTQGTITYKTYDYKILQWKDTVENFTIATANQMLIWGKRYMEGTNSRELVGATFYYNYGSGNMTITTTGTDVAKVVSHKSFHIQSKDKITVYALQCAMRTAEACIVLPVPAHGKEYYVMSYNSDYDGNPPTPSQFVIVATEDNTSVTIRQSCKIVWQTGEQEPTNPHTITLNKGDVYLVQAYIDNNENIKTDLSGTHLIGNKPFAVFSGHVRATLPIEAILVGDADNPSRDCLLEQMIPVHSWGKNAIITPFKVPVGIQNEKNPVELKYKDLYRVMAAKDSTIIFIDGIPLDTTVNAGNFIELDLTQASLITANKPIMAVQYKKTSQIDYYSSLSNATGDPLMLVVPPVEQYKKTYNVICPLVLNMAFPEQYLTIVAPDTSTSKIKLDGVFLQTAIFQNIPNSGFSYTQIRTTSGGHNIVCDDPISVQVYGYGYAISYGYLGGMSFKDLEKDKIAYSIDSCYQNAIFSYNETFSSGIKSYLVLENINCNIVEESFASKNLKLSITKNNIYDNAYFTIKIIDIYDEETIISDTILSYSIVVSGIEQGQNSTTIDFGECKIGSLNKSSIKITNLSSFPVTIDNNSLLFSNKVNFSISQEDLPILLKAGETLDVNIYYAPTNSGGRNNLTDYDTLKIASMCGRVMVYLEGVPQADTLDFLGKCDIPIRAIADSIDLDLVLPIIYPNPAGASQATIYRFNVLADGMASTEVEISIQNINGETILPVLKTTLPLGNYEIELPIAHLSAGSYIVKFTSAGKHKIYKLLVL